jgi:ketosteroid isomerase-like protein
MLILSNEACSFETASHKRVRLNLFYQTEFILSLKSTATVGLEPTTNRLTAYCSTTLLSRFSTSELRRRESMGKGVGSKTLFNPPSWSSQPMELRPSDKDKRDVENTIRAFFEAGKNKDLTTLADFHSSRDTFTKFDENPPFTRQTSDDAFVYEQAAFANISDYSYSIDELRVDLLGDVAIATFYLAYSGMFVNDYSFEGSPVHSRSRVTMVLVRTSKGWRMAHEHFSRVPEPASPKGR